MFSCQFPLASHFCMQLGPNPNLSSSPSTRTLTFLHRLAGITDPTEKSERMTQVDLLLRQRYGDEIKSLEYALHQLSDEQIRIREKIRTLEGMKKELSAAN